MKRPSTEYLLVVVSCGSGFQPEVRPDAGDGGSGVAGRKNSYSIRPFVRVRSIGTRRRWLSTSRSTRRWIVSPSLCDWTLVRLDDDVAGLQVGPVRRMSREDFIDPEAAARGGHLEAEPGMLNPHA